MKGSVNVPAVQEAIRKAVKAQLGTIARSRSGEFPVTDDAFDVSFEPTVAGTAPSGKIYFYPHVSEGVDGSITDALNSNIVDPFRDLLESQLGGNNSTTYNDRDSQYESNSWADLVEALNKVLDKKFQVDPKVARVDPSFGRLL